MADNSTGKIGASEAPSSVGKTATLTFWNAQHGGSGDIVLATNPNGHITIRQH